MRDICFIAHPRKGYHLPDFWASQVNNYLNKQVNSNPAQPHVRQKLRLMDWMDCIDAFHLNDHRILDDQVDAVTKLDLFSVKNYWQTDLAGDCESALSEFMGEASLVGALE
ncbi:MAG: hypothetical protein WBM24_22230 [Candidatus Sulfotelmatobacter sp.]